jgi:5-methyltetrahydropteroyltriglutamate--homocysteine methyltransferase
VEKIEYQDPITVEDQQYIRSTLPKNRGLLGVITGPYTLTQSCVDLYYHDEEKVAFDFAKALHEEALLLQDQVDLISIDEPFFSNTMPSYGTELIGTITNHLSCPTRLHVCGDVSSIVPTLLDMPVDILSHEFKASPQLFNIFREHPDGSKKICLGSVRSDNPAVETIEDIRTHLEKAQEIFEKRITQLAPDCGQRLLPRNVAFQKLKHLVQAGEMVYGR